MDLHYTVGSNYKTFTGAAQSCKNWVGKTSNLDNVYSTQYKLHDFCNFLGFFASDLWKTGWANAQPAHTVAPPLISCHSNLSNCGHSNKGINVAFDYEIATSNVRSDASVMTLKIKNLELTLEPGLFGRKYHIEKSKYYSDIKSFLQFEILIMNELLFIW